MDRLVLTSEVVSQVKCSGANPLSYSNSYGAEEHFKGLVDLIKMKAILA